MNKMLVVMAMGVMFATSALAEVSTDTSCAVPYKGIEAFASCVDGKLFYRPYAEGKSAVELGYVGAEVMDTVGVRMPVVIPTAEQFRQEACDEKRWDAVEMYGCN